MGGRNAEASLYRRLPTGEAMQALGLDQWVDAPTVAIEALPDPVPSPPIPLAALTASSPGRFVMEQGVLVWSPPPSLRGRDIVLVVFDAELSVLAEISHSAAGADRRHFVLAPGAAEQARFAEVRYVDGKSGLAGIEHPAALRRSRREPLGGAAARAADWFSNTVDLNLFALEALDALSRADIEAAAGSDRIAPSRRCGTNRQASETENRHLSYEDFMRERSRNDPQGAALSDSAIEGLHCDHVRQLLNRLSEFDDGTEGDSDDLDEQSSEESERAPNAESVQPSERRVDAAEFEKAVHAYARACASDGATGALEVLRLRLWLMLLLYNARCAALPQGLSPTLNDQGWTRLAFRVLTAFFVGREAPITRLVVDRAAGGIPADFLETWATVLWALDAIERHCPDTPPRESFLPYLGKLRLQIGAALRLDAADLESPAFRDKWIGLERQLGARLG